MRQEWGIKAAAAALKQASMPQRLRPRLGYEKQDVPPGSLMYRSSDAVAGDAGVYGAAEPVSTSEALGAYPEPSFAMNVTEPSQAPISCVDGDSS